jgi:hypothetical protein
MYKNLSASLISFPSRAFVKATGVPIVISLSLSIWYYKIQTFKKRIIFPILILPVDKSQDAPVSVPVCTLNVSPPPTTPMDMWIIAIFLK